jgi:hypothetical protein
MNACHSSGVKRRTAPAASLLFRTPTSPADRSATSTQLPFAKLSELFTHSGRLSSAGMAYPLTGFFCVFALHTRLPTTKALPRVTVRREASRHHTSHAPDSAQVTLLTSKRLLNAHTTIKITQAFESPSIQSGVWLRLITTVTLAADMPADPGLSAADPFQPGCDRGPASALVPPPRRTQIPLFKQIPYRM